MAGFDNEVVYADNVDFSGGATVSAKVTADGELLIGATASPNIRVGSLASADGTVVITAGAGTIDLSSAGVSISPFIEKAIDYSIALTDETIGVTDNTATRTMTLPSGAATRQSFTVKDQAGTAGGSGGGFAIVIDTAGAETIDGAATATINSDYGALRFYFNGTNYFVY